MYVYVFNYSLVRLVNISVIVVSETEQFRWWNCIKALKKHFFVNVNRPRRLNLPLRSHCSSVRLFILAAQSPTPEFKLLLLIVWQVWDFTPVCNLIYKIQKRETTKRQQRSCRTLKMTAFNLNILRLNQDCCYGSTVLRGANNSGADSMDQERVDL